MTIPNWRSEWVAVKCEIAMALARGDCGGGYCEAVILLCAVLNSLAAEVWNGRGIDRKRFIELLVGWGSLTRELRTISVPLLVQKLETMGCPEWQDSQLLRSEILGFDVTSILVGSDVDKQEDELALLSPRLSSRLLRKCSYACLLYEQLRSSYAHEYRPGDRCDSQPMAIGTLALVSYVNRRVRVRPLEAVRLIHFPVEWLVRLVMDIAGSVDESSLLLPCERPSRWWIEGDSPEVV